MNKKVIYALILIGLCTIVLLINVGALDGITIDLFFTKIHAAKSMVLLGTITIGVVIGLLLK